MSKKDSSAKHCLSGPIVPLTAPFEDARGVIQTLVDGGIQSVQVITSEANTVRANHYHKTDSHFMYLIKGVMKYFYRPVGDKSDPAWLVVNAGQMVFTPPLVEHAVEFLEDSEFINITSKPRDQDSYEDDLVRVELHKLLDKRADPMTLPYHHKRSDCRLCDSNAPKRVLKLTPTPPANALVTAADKDKTQIAYPLDVYRCASCGHLQLLDIVDPEILFSHYPYVSSTSPVMVGFLRDQCAAIVRRLKLKPGDLVVEFGSNDGTLLRFFKEAGMRVLGVDPASNVAPDANEIETICDFFNAELGKRIREQYGPAKAICAYNVCAHIDDLRGVVEGIRLLLAPDGQFVFEVGYLLDVYRKTLFDTIYHEHLDFHHVEPLKRFFASNGLKLLHVEHSDIQGGALVSYVGDLSDQEDSTVAEFIGLEHQAGLHLSETFLHWGDMIRRKGEELMVLLLDLKAKGRSIAAYGATAKATTLMYHFGLNNSILDYIVDDNSLKQGMFTPGLHIPVLSPEVLYRKKPDYVLLLAWNFAAPIIDKHRLYAGDDSRFIIPLPDLVIIKRGEG